MFHKNRVWCISEIEYPTELVEKLTQHTWTLCTAFKIGDCLFLNDALSENGAQEYAILKVEDGQYRQIESVTFSWVTQEKALDYINQAINGDLVCEDFAHVVKPKLQTPQEHGSCELCA